MNSIKTIKKVDQNLYKKGIIYFILYRIYFFCIRVGMHLFCLCKYGTFYHKLDITYQLEKKQDVHEIYFEKQKKKLLNTFIKDSTSIWNSNIEPECYSLESLSKIYIEDNHPIEMKWKQRILLESTPRGNIMMYYDIFKQAFAYVSDNQSIPYMILNACAMKYVIVFKCRDFFIDTEIVPKEYISPLITLEEESEKKEIETIKEKKKELGIDFKNAPFAKLKTYRSVEIIKDNSKIEETKIYKNRFRYLGKISNLSLLISPVKKDVLKHNEKIDYSTFKKQYRHTFS
jgi:hypothetical protein